MAFRGAMVPFMRPTNDWWDLWDFPSRIFDQHFGVGLRDEDLLPSAMNSLYMRPRRQLMRQLSGNSSLNSGFSEVKNDPNQFRVQLDVSHFAPQELTVKTIDGNTIIIEAKHEEKMDEHGFVSRQFTRKYMLPKDIDVEQIASSLTPDGHLIVTAPRKALESKPNEKVIPITPITSVPPPLATATATPIPVQKESQPQQ